MKLEEEAKILNIFFMGKSPFPEPQKVEYVRNSWGRKRFKKGKRYELNKVRCIVCLVLEKSGLWGKESACSAGDTRDAGLIPGLGRSLEEEVAARFSILAWRSRSSPGG